MFGSAVGTPMSAGERAAQLPHRSRWFRTSTRAEWTPRELRHSFVSVLSDAGVPLEENSRLVGHSDATVTELVYRHQLKPVIQAGATVMDQLFGNANPESVVTNFVTQVSDGDDAGE